MTARPRILIFTIWLILLIIWNYGVPQALPIDDVLVGIGLWGISKVLETKLIRTKNGKI